MVTGWGRWETVSVDRGGERLEYTFCPDPETGWRVGAWSKFARSPSGNWQLLESWTREHSRDAWEPELSADVLLALQAQLAHRGPLRGVRSVQTAAAGIGVLAIAWGVWAFLI